MRWFLRPCELRMTHVVEVPPRVKTRSTRVLRRFYVLQEVVLTKFGGKQTVGVFFVVFFFVCVFV